jgi:macrolide transport system ATP-binding/permease protein
VLVFTTVVAVLTGILCGLMPAIEVSRFDLMATLKEGAGRFTRGKRRLSSTLVAAQVAVSLLLLIVAGLFIRGAQKAEAVDLGFDRRNLQLLSVDLDKQDYSPTRGREFIRRLLEKIRSMPGVRAAAAAKCIPFDQQGSAAVLRDDQAANQRSEAIAVFTNVVGPDYFRAMGMRLLVGREFGEHDDESAPRVAVINEALARRLWPGQSALGRKVRLASGDMLQVVGVAQSGKYAFLNEDPRPYLYVSLEQDYSAPTIFHVRTAGNPASLVPGLRQAARALDPELPVYGVKTMQDHLQHGYLFAAIVMGGALSSVFGLLGLALACMGLYGVVTNSVGRRTREIGVRTALGATRGDILRLVIRQAMLMVVVGAAVGIVAGIEAGQLLKRVLFSVDSADWVTFALMIALLVVVALIACLVPAHKATRVDPTTALRYE